jgi:hypothetical protein
MDRRSSLRVIGGTVAGATLGGIWGTARAARPDNRPDIIVVVVDDLRRLTSVNRSRVGRFYRW